MDSRIEKVFGDYWLHWEGVHSDGSDLKISANNVPCADLQEIQTRLKEIARDWRITDVTVSKWEGNEYRPVKLSSNFT